MLITGGLGFIGSNLAARLVDSGADVTIVDSLIPEYGGLVHNVRDIADRVHGEHLRRPRPHSDARTSCATRTSSSTWPGRRATSTR